MIVKGDNEPETVRFGSLKVGDSFLFAGALYLKTTHKLYHNSVSLTGNELDKILPDNLVIPVSASISWKYK